MKIYVKTYGCSLNQADSETMSGLLVDAGHQLSSEEDADVVVYNTCTVKHPSEQRFLAELEKQGKRVVLAGCIPEADKTGYLDAYPTIGTEQLSKTVEVVEAAHQGSVVRFGGKSQEKRLNIPKIRVNPFVEIVPISKGCLSNCTYCKTKQARGNLSSFRPREIAEQVEAAVQDGVKEVWLTSQDNGAYGLDIKTNPGELLKRVASVEGDFMIRFGMTNPDWAKKWLDKLIEAYKHPKVYKFLHLPIQAGSDAVLKHMGRRCTADDIRMIVSKFREEIPGITIATDIICGYPTETEEDFQATLDLVEELKFPVVNISKFYSRPDTAAAKLPQLDSQVIKDRSRRLTELFESFSDQHKDKVGKTVRTLFVDRKNGSNIGKTESYTQVLVNSPVDLRGSWEEVYVKTTTRDDLRGHTNIETERKVSFS